MMSLIYEIYDKIWYSDVIINGKSYSYVVMIHYDSNIAMF